MPMFPSLPEGATLFELFARFPDIAQYLAARNEYVMRGPSPLSEGERELIAAFVSSLNSCNYCAGSHGEAAKAFGIPEQTIAMLAEDIDTAPVNKKLRPMLRFVEKLTRSPARMTSADADAVFSAGWNEEALFSAILVCCAFNFMNRLVDGCGLVASEAQATNGGRFLFEQGYAAVPDAASKKSG
ncbi:MAG: carboxymuconolactone decarboxylase family protein [Woeseia sp.]